MEVARRHRAYCAGCYPTYVQDTVARTIKKHRMLEPGERVLVAVSGGKDSLALWEILHRLGYAVDGLHLQLGIGGYSRRSREATEQFADARGFSLRVVELESDVGFTIPLAAKASAQAACGACGLSKRHLLNSTALAGDYPVVATGHNLDDEAAVLLGNVLSWSMDALVRQQPVLPAAPGFARRVKPLVNLTEQEIAAYCVLTGIDYIVEECPMAAGNRHLTLKAALATIEERSPGAKETFFRGYLDKLRPVLADVQQETAPVELHECAECGSPTTGSVCAFCRLKRRVSSPHPRGRGRRGRRGQSAPTAPAPDVA